MPTTKHGAKYVSDGCLARQCVDAYYQHTHAVSDVEALLRGDVLAFRGTDSTGDLYDTLDFRPTWSYPLKAFVHRGRYKSVYEFFIEFFDQFATLPPLIVTGHSLGGADAEIFGALMTAFKHPPQEITTFGNPPIAGWRLGRVLRDVDRVTYIGDRDWRAAKPPWLWRWMYRRTCGVIEVPNCGHNRHDYARRMTDAGY